MNIAIDIQPVASPSKNRGMGIYTYNLLKEIFKVDNKNTYYLFNCCGECIFDHEELPENVHYFSFYPGKDRFLVQKHKVWQNDYSQLLEGLYKSFIKKNNIDIFIITSLFDQYICYSREWFLDVPVAVIAYDLIPLIFKEQYLYDKNAEKWYMDAVSFLEKADHLLAISESVRDDLIKYLNIDSARITTIYSGVGDQFNIFSYSRDRKRSIFKKYKIKNKFMIFPGGGDYRKNVYNTIKAYLNMPASLVQKYQFVITGITSDEYRNELLMLAAEKQLTNRVLVNGHIPIEDLICLYNLSDLLVFTSMYEGFGLPVIEALKCGSNVLTSNNSSLGEVGTGAAVQVDPFDIDAITKGMIKALTATDFTQLKQGVEKKLAQYTWQNSAHLTLDAINTLTSKIAVNTRKKLAFFTPLNPLRSGISDYSEDIIDSLCQYCDIDVYIDDGYWPTKKFAKNVKVLNHKLFPGNSKLYDEFLYQMGNSSFHSYMIPYIQSFPGTVVIHDYNMHLLVYSYFIENNARYREYLKLEVDNINQYMVNFSKRNIENIPVNRFVSDYARKLIVHSEYAKKELLKKNPLYNIRKINSYAKIEPTQNTSVLRSQYGIEKDTFVLASFGHAAYIKRIIPILEAVAALREKYDHIKYYIVGDVLDEIKNEMQNFIEKHHMQDSVITTGNIDMQAFKDYIQMSDVCLNLRYPYYGETSASFMRILAAGKPAIVTDIGSFSEVPDDCCMKIGYDNEIQEIIGCIDTIMKDPGLLQYYGNNARKFAETYLDIDKIVLEYYDLLFNDSVMYFSNSELKNITLNEIIPVGYSQDEIHQLSKTLAYIIDR